MASARYPPLKPSELDPEQRALHDQIAPMIEAHFNGKVKIIDEDGALLGPFAVLLRTPSLATAWFSLGREVNELLVVSPAARETAILAVGSVFQAGFELYSHSIVAGHASDLTDRQIDSIRKGQKPEGEEKLDAACDVAFDLGVSLAGRPGPLSKEIWTRACSVLGKDSTLALIHLIAHYANTCVLLNAADVQVPE